MKETSLDAQKDAQTSLDAQKEISISIICRNLEVFFIYKIISIECDPVWKTWLHKLFSSGILFFFLSFLIFSFFSLSPFSSLPLPLFLFLSFSLSCHSSLKTSESVIHDDWRSTNSSTWFIHVKFMMKGNYLCKLKKKYLPNRKKFYIQQSKT